MQNTLDIYRQGVKIATVDIDENTVFSSKLPGTEIITCPIDSLQVLSLQEEDYIIHKGVVYKIRILPDFGKSSETLAKSYKIDFLARFYDLHDTYVQDEGAHVFPYFGSAADHLQLLVDSANLTDTGWVLGTVEATDDLLLNYDWTFARPALDMIAEAFKLEWNAVGTTINMVSTIGNDTGLTFEMGRGKGLHSITRSSDTSKEKINRVYGIGGSRNIDSTYRNGEEDNLVFEERYVETPGVTAGTERVRMGKYENPELYPKFEGVVANPQFTIVDGNITSATIQDQNINFDLMQHLQEGVKPKVSFLTGPVTGVEFEISGYNHTTKTVTLIPFTDTTGYYYPSDTSKPEAGNKFTFIDVRMPSAYVATWEAKLKTETLAFLNQNKSQRLIYGVVPDEKHLRDNNIQLKVGDRATAIDGDMGVNEVLRFTEISYPLVNEFKISGVIGNDIVYNPVAKLFADVLSVTKQVQVISKQGLINAKRSAQNLRTLETSIFDTDGKFDSDKINVGVLSTALAIIGVKSQNFILNGVRVTDNLNGDPNAVSISGGTLIHLEYNNAGNANAWVMTLLNLSGLVSNSFYYIYAKCSKVSQVGSWVITTDQIKVDDVSGFYHFLAGVVYPVNNGFRDTELTNGITDITGARIKTGVIQGRTGALVINLETGEITGTLTFKSASGAYLPVSGVATNANNALNNVAQVAGNLSNLEANLGGLAYKSAVQSAMQDEGMIIGGYLKNTLIDTQAIIVSGGLATQSYAQGVATSAGANALSNATALVNNLQIGGVNTFGSTTTYSNVVNLFNLTYIKNGDYAGVVVTNGLAIVGKPSVFGRLRIDGVITSNGYWTISGYIQSNTTDNLRIDICDEGTTYITITPIKTFFQLTVNVTQFSSTVYNFVDIEEIPNVYVWLSDLKVEKGNKATAWSPSLTDVTATSATLAIAAQTAATNYATSQSAFEREVAKAYADGKVTTEEAARISQANANLAEAKADSQAKFLTAVTNANGYTDAKAIATISTAQNYADSISTTKANAAVLSATSAASSDATAKANAARVNAVIDSQALINSLAIGAVNTFGASTTYSDVVNLLNLTYIKDGSYNGQSIKNGLAVLGSPSGGGMFRIKNVINSNGYWTISGYAHSNSGPVDISVDICDQGATNINVTTIKSFFQVTVNVTQYSESLYNFVDFSAIPYIYLYLNNIKIEKGQKATDWSPAIADVDASIALAKSTADAAQAAYTTLTSKLKGASELDIDYAAAQGVTAIKNGSVLTFKVEAAYIKSNVINAQYIESLEIVAPSLRTANSGTKRFEATQSTNSAILYSASNEELVRIDDNLAIERFTLSGPVRGAGIRVGQEASYSTSISRFGFTNIVGGARKHLIGTNPLNDKGVIILDAGDTFEINNLRNYFGGTGMANYRLYVDQIQNDTGQSWQAICVEQI